jgi:hypothetical protein
MLIKLYKNVLRFVERRDMMNAHEQRIGKDNALDSKPTKKRVSLRHSTTELIVDDIDAYQQCFYTIR